MGLVGGATIGALVGIIEGDSSSESELVQFVYTIGGAGGGLVVGSIAGLCIRTDRWTPVYER